MHDQRNTLEHIILQLTNTHPVWRAPVRAVQALKSLAGGLELRHPDPKLLEDLDARSMAQKANRNPEMFEKFEGLLEVGVCSVCV
jgi:hypothetical protein